MKSEDRLVQWKLHPSIRGQFAFELYKAMIFNKNIYLLTGDLGFSMFEPMKEDFPDRYANCGASEQAMMGIAVGLAQSGKIPFVYSITNFLLYRPYETIRNYVNYEKANVKLIGSGRDQDYLHDGISHWSEDARGILKTFKNIKQYWPDTKEEIPGILDTMIEEDAPGFLSLKR